MKPSHVSLAIQASVLMNVPLFIWGPPGVGKSSAVLQAATALSGHRGLLFLDELTNAPQQTQGALYQLCLDRRVGEYVMPDGWRIIAAGNRKDDRGVHHRMPDPLVDRFFHVDFEHNMEDWTAWALTAHEALPQVPANMIDFRAGLRDSVDIMGLPAYRDEETDDGARGVTYYNLPAGLPRMAYGTPEERVRGVIRPEVVAFIRMREGLLHNHQHDRKCHAFATPRGWADVSKVLDLPAQFRDIENELIRGRVGDAAASEFISFLKLFREMVSPDEIIRDPRGAEVPTNTSTLYALAEALARRANLKTIRPVLEYAGRMPAEYRQCLVSSMIRVSPELTATPEYTIWAARHGNKKTRA